MNAEAIPEPLREGAKEFTRRWSFWRVLLTFFLGLWAVLFLGVAALGVFALIVYHHVVQPGYPGPETTLVVPDGATGRDIGALLAEEDLVEHEGFFRLALRIDGTGKSIQHGEYVMPTGLSALEILHRLQDGPSRHVLGEQFKVTVPEGLPIALAADLFDAPDQFIAAAEDPELVSRYDVPGETLEGFLMPDTYFFDEEPNEREVVERMARLFEAAYDELLAEIPGAAGFDKMSIVTVASLVEEEARIDEERPIIASVVYNRLEKGMPLQYDSTLQYALNKYGQRILNVDKEVDSPYNTYKYKGLPPGPISNPGRASLRAAMQPAETDYLYFVSNADGSHTFSRTLAEHERARARYNREVAEQRRQLAQ